MKKLAFLIIACLIFKVSLGQERVYDGIAKQLGETAPEVEQLWPFEDMPTKDLHHFTVTYKLPFSDGKDSEITFDFDSIKTMKSAVYDHQQFPQDRLLALVKSEIPQSFTLEFEQQNPAKYGVLFANDSEEGVAEIYFLAGSEGKSELLYFKLGAEESRHLRVNLNSKLAHRKVDIIDDLQSRFQGADLEVKEVWSPQEAYLLSDAKNNPKGLVISNVTFRNKVPMPLSGREDLEILVETNQLIDGVFLIAEKDKVSLKEFGESVRQLIPSGYEKLISHRSGDNAFELFTLIEPDSDMVLYFSQSEKVVFVYYAEVEKGADYIDNLVFEIKEKIKTVES